MTGPVAQHYDDGLVQLDRQAITLRRYHFPSGTSKVIPLRAIRGYRAEPLGMFTQRFRIWGSSDLRRWLPLDVGRPLKSTLVTLDVPGAPRSSWPCSTNSSPTSRYSSNRASYYETRWRSSEIASDSVSYTRTTASSPGCRKVVSPSGV